MIAGTGLIGVSKDNLPRIGVTPGLTATFAEIELDTETGKFKILEMLCVADCGTVLHPQGLAHQIRGGNVMGMPGAAGTARLRSEARHFHHGAALPGEVAWLSRRAGGDRLGRGREARSTEPGGREGCRRTAARFGAAAITTAIADRSGDTCSTAHPFRPT